MSAAISSIPVKAARKKSKRRSVTEPDLSYPQPVIQNGAVLPFDRERAYSPINAPVAFQPSEQRILPLGNQIYAGDTIATLQGFEDNSFDACITDPPYNIARGNKKGMTWAFSNHVTMHEKWDAYSTDDYERFTAAWMSEVCRVVKPNGNIFIFGSYHNIYTVGAIATRMEMKILNSIIWAKPNAQPNITCRMFTESTEQLVWICNNHFKKASKWTYNYAHMKALNGGKQMRNYWEIPLTPKSEKTEGKHPAQKPLALMERIVLAGTHPGDRVLDCFAGSGSTLLACDKLDRRWIGIERDDNYCDLAYRRIDRERQQRRLLPVNT